LGSALRRQIKRFKGLGEMNEGVARNHDESGNANFEGDFNDDTPSMPTKCSRF
jgi:hypothetical protein